MRWLGVVMVLIGWGTAGWVIWREWRAVQRTRRMPSPQEIPLSILLRATGSLRRVR